MKAMNPTNHYYKCLIVLLFFVTISIIYLTKKFDIFVIATVKERDNIKPTNINSFSFDQFSFKIENLSSSSEPTQCTQNKTNKQFSISIDGIQYPRYVPLYYNKSINFECMNKNNRRKRILLWTKFVGAPDFHYGLGNGSPFSKNRCPVTNCEITNDRNLYNESDIIVMHIPEITELPNYRFDFQRWALYLYESPMNTNQLNLKRFDGLFNMTSTYRLDSNTTSIYFAQSTFYWQYNKNFDSNQDFLSIKDQFAVALISNCNDKSNRLNYIHELQKYVPIDIIGGCGYRECPFDCKIYLTHKYKFYFSFENSFCKDYITEKFFGILRFNIIPVVLGGGQYDLFVPKSGYINALDYKRPKDLADYLLYLSQNNTAYNAYFKWKQYVIFDMFNPFHGHICEWCILLNLDSYRKMDSHVVNDLNSFWNSDTDCRIAKSIDYFNFD